MALYPVIGSFMLMIAYILWCEGCSEMGYQLSWSVMREDIWWIFLSVVGFVFSFLIIDEAKKKSSTTKKSPSLHIVLNSFIAILSPILVMYVAVENSVGTGSLPIFFAVAIGMIVGSSSYLDIRIKYWKNLPNELQSLKLRHDLIWRLIHISLWIVTILVVSGYYILYTQSIAFVEENLRLTHPSAGKLSIAFALPGVFLLLGLWFGVLSPLFGYALTIPRKVAFRKKGKLKLK